MIRPALALHHVRRHQLRAHVDGFKIDRDRAPPVLERVVQDGLGRRIDRRVVDEDVDLAESCDQIGDDRAVGFVVGDVELIGPRPCRPPP